jgi:catechol 2,3-dioxygenase-like lactoylglutathione lyase family enzyme
MIGPVLDHVVVNVRGELDQAAAAYRRLGFSLTERGHHTLGSSNHLAVFTQNYLELLGFESGRETERADLWRHPSGLTGLVFKTPDALAVHAHLAETGILVENPAEFSRPVDLPEGARDASFRVVRIGSELVPNGRVFFCQHFTPELVWRNEWRQHPNGALDVVEFVIAAAAPDRTADLYRSIFGAESISDIPNGRMMRAGVATVLILTPDEVERRFAGAAPKSDDGSDRMVALTMRTRSLRQAGESLRAGNVTPRVTSPDRLVVSMEDAAGVALAFVA